ncbi:DUF3017 domain-containing protein [Luteococcus sp. H138]|uniref:DUF3017 domain-containing protein n=1 Tax=unclassified Luteococcus TaxID=2639923 RepID=UPI00313B9BAE
MGSSTEQHERDTALAKARALASGRTLNQWPLAAVLLCLAVSLGITATGHWRRGAFAIGCSVLLGGILRMVLPNRVAGLLAVRQRWFDVALLLIVGGAILGLTLVVPHSKPGLG